MMTLTGTLPRLKKNRSFQLGKLPDKGTSEPLLKPEHALSQLQSVFDVVQMALRGELMEYGTQASLLQPNSTEQQRILRSSRSDINAVLAAAQGIKLPSHNLLHPAGDIQPRPAKTPSVSPVPNYNPDDYWWSQYSELNLNQYSVGSPCRTICTVCGSPPCPDLNLIHYINRTANQ